MAAFFKLISKTPYAMCPPKADMYFTFTTRRLKKRFHVSNNAQLSLIKTKTP